MDGADLPHPALEDLRDIVLPATADGGHLSDIAAAIGLGLLLALCLYGIVRAITVRLPADKTAISPKAAIRAARDLSDQERMHELARIAARVDRDLPRHLFPDLYRDTPVPDLDHAARVLLGRLG